MIRRKLKAAKAEPTVAEFGYRAIPISVSDTHSRANVNKSTDDQVDMVRQIVDWVRAQSRPMRIDAAAATAFGCSMEGDVPVERVARVAKALAEIGVDCIALAGPGPAAGSAQAAGAGLAE